MNCPHQRCPGCPQKATPYPQQLVAKAARLKAAVSLFPHLPEPAAIEGSAWETAYRHRLKLPVHHGNTVSIGLYHQGKVLHTPDCPVLAEPLREALPALLTWLEGKRRIHSVDLRVSNATGELQVVFAALQGGLPGGKQAALQLMQATKITSVAVSQADPERKRVMGSRPSVVAGASIIEERIGDTAYDILPGAFFQTDPRQAERLHDKVLAAVGDARTVLDLYAGVGAYALRLAPRVQRVIAVEEVPQAAAAARRRAPANVEVITSRVEDLKLRDRVDVAILNPARRGSDPHSLAMIARLAKRLIYVSCGPETLARDLDILANHGQRVVSLEPIDLFPQTDEVETVVVLERGPVLSGPWKNRSPSGAPGKPLVTIALAIGPVRKGPGITPLGEVASHTLVRLERSPNLAIAGAHKPTARFFREKAGLMRPFLHVARSNRGTAPLHGDLVLTLRALGASEALIRKANA